MLSLVGMAYIVSAFSRRRSEWCDVALLLGQEKTIQWLIPKETDAHLPTIVEDLRSILAGNQLAWPHELPFLGPDSNNNPGLQLHSLRALPDVPSGRRMYTAIYTTWNGDTYPFVVLTPSGVASIGSDGLRHILLNLHRTKASFPDITHQKCC